MLHGRMLLLNKIILFLSIVLLLVRVLLLNRMIRLQYIMLMFGRMPLPGMGIVLLGRMLLPDGMVVLLGMVLLRGRMLLQQNGATFLHDATSRTDATRRRCRIRSRRRRRLRRRRCRRRRRRRCNLPTSTHERAIGPFSKISNGRRHRFKGGGEQGEGGKKGRARFRSTGWLDCNPQTVFWRST